MKHVISTSLALILAGSTLPGKPLAELIRDDSQLLLTVRSFSDLRSGWEQHPFAELRDEPGVQAFFEALTDDADEADAPGFTEVMEETFGLTYDELFELFPGQAAFSLHNMAALMLGQTERPEGVFLAEFSGDKARLEELMQIQFERNAKAQKEANPLVEHEMVEERFMGETLHFDETFDGESTYVEDGYALVDGIFILATPESRLRETVEFIKAGGGSPLAESGPYRRSRDSVGRGDVGWYVNLSAIMPPLNDALLELTVQGNLAMFGVTARSLENALSLESMEALYGYADLTEDGIASYGGLLYREKAGLLSLLTYGDGTLPEADYVPGDVLSTSVSLFDFSAMLANLEKLLTVASPNLPTLLDMQLQTMRSNTGIDFRTAFLENLGDEMVTMAVMDSTARASDAFVQPQQLYVIDVKDALSLSQAIETMKDMAPQVKHLIEVQEFQGETIYTVKGQPDPNMPDVKPNDFSYVITRSHLIAASGPVSLLQEALSRMDASGGGFWDLPETEALFEPIAAPNPVARSYYDLEQLFGMLARVMAQSGALEAQGGRLADAGLLRDVEAPFRVVSEMNEEPDGFFMRARITKSEANE